MNKCIYREKFKDKDIYACTAFLNWWEKDSPKDRLFLTESDCMCELYEEEKCMRVKKFIELADFNTTVAITKTDDCKIIESPNDRFLNKKVKYFEIKNDILILHV